MFTPRRILLVVVGTAVCLGGYLAYAQALGRVDGLPMLPDRFAQVADPKNVPAPQPFQSSPIERKLEQAFGAGCIEIDSRQYRQAFEVGSKGIVVAGNPVFKEGKVYISPLSVAVFGKQKGPTGVPEITTLHSDRGILTFDQPVDSLMSLSGRHIVKAYIESDQEIPFRDPRKGRIHIRNNRRTEDRKDSLEVLTVGPLLYLAGETENDISTVTTDNFLEVYDWQNNRALGLVQENVVLPTVVGRGMKMVLKAEKAAPGKQDKPPAGNKVTGVESLHLNSEVTMNLWSNPGQSFLGGDAPKPPPAPGSTPIPPAAEERSLVQIETQGPFHYDMVKELALFENAPSINPNLPNSVRATRKSKGEQLDIIKCDTMELKFKRTEKPAPAPADFANPPPPGSAPPPPESDRQIERVHAWGTSIAISSDAEKLNAQGNDLVYEETARTTTLKGNPDDGIFVVKEGNVIQSRGELVLKMNPKPDPKPNPAPGAAPPAPTAPPASGNGIREARVRGPGIVGMGEIDPATGRHIQKANWNDWLTFTRVVENEQPVQILRLTGRAGFRDYKKNQTLDAEEIRVWLKDSEGENRPPAVVEVAAIPAEANKAVAEVKRDPKPIRLEATRNVTMLSPEFILRDADLLNVYFREVPLVEVPPAAAPPKPSGSPPGGIPPPGGVPGQPPTGQPPVPEPKKEEPRPIQIWARKMDAFVLRKVPRFDRDKTVNELERAYCVGKVHVVQAPPADKPKTIGLRMEAHELFLLNRGENLFKLTLKAESEAISRDTPAELHMEEISLLGPVILVDQGDNHAQVPGWGSMRMKTATDMQGNKLEKDSNVFIHWREGMEFYGSDKLARFTGSVQADQEESGSRVLCPVMQVNLDREMVFKQSTGSGPRQNPRIDRVYCERGRVLPGEVGKPVIASEEKRENSKLVKLQRIETEELDYINRLDPNDKEKTGDTKSHGPGTVLMFGPGTEDTFDTADKPKPPNASTAPPKEIMKLTWIEFAGQMQTFGRNRAKFLGPVTTMHGPSDRPDLRLVKGDLPPGWVQLQCRKAMTVTSVEVFDERAPKPANGKLPEPKLARLMDAEGDVRVLGENFDGTAEQVKYDETKHLLFFIGSKQNPAMLQQSAGVGHPIRTTRAERIRYNTLTRATSEEGSVGTSISP